MAELVFCINCMYLTTRKDKSLECECPRNLENIVTWYDESLQPKRHASVINQNNDCIWFREKPI